MKPERFRKFIEKQKKAIEDFKWTESEKIGHDLGESAVKSWISKNAKKFRKDFALEDLKESLKELKELRNIMREQLNQIVKLENILDKCDEKIVESIELLESESNNNSNGKEEK